MCGCREVQASGASTRVLIAGLTRGRRYFFRAAAGNVKGWGPCTVSVPRSVVPSSEYIEIYALNYIIYKISVRLIKLI